MIYGGGREYDVCSMSMTVVTAGVLCVCVCVCRRMRWSGMQALAGLLTAAAVSVLSSDNAIAAAHIDNNVVYRRRNDVGT